MKKILIIALLFLTDYAVSQVTLNPGIDTSSTTHKEILAFWESYISSNPSKNNPEYFRYWSEAEKKEWNHPDLSLHSIGQNSLFTMGYKTVLSILPYKDEYFQIKTAFGWGDSTDHVYLIAIANHYVKEVDGEYKLFSHMKVDQEELQVNETSQYKVYSLKGSAVPEHILNRLTEFILNLRSDYAIKEKKRLKVIYGETSYDMYRLLGFDFNLMTSTNNPSNGMSNAPNDLILLSGLSSLFHEATHIYLNPLFPGSPLLEGLATFYGGSMGKSLEEGIRFLNDYVSENPEIDLYKKLQEGYFYLNNEYNPIYTLQGLLVKSAHEREGLKGIKQLMAIDNYEEIFEQYFGIEDTEKIDSFLKTELKKS